MTRSKIIGVSIVVGLIVVGLIVVVLFAAKPKGIQPIELDTQRQLLFDDLFLEKKQGITLRMVPPMQNDEPVLIADKPWENMGIGAYSTVMRENGKYRMWYDVGTTDRKGTERRIVCYAESLDGVNWVKPELGLIEFDGSTNNNIVAPLTSGASQQGASVMLDNQAPQEERYKMWFKYHPNSEAETKETAGLGLCAMVSPDGLRWKMIDHGYPLSRGNSADSQNVPFWDEDLGKYVAFVRMKVLKTDTRQRDCFVGLMTSEDFRNWTRAKKIFKADEQIPVPKDNRHLPPFVDFYTPVGMKVPGVPNAYILLPTPYYHWRKDKFPSTIDVSLATSRNLVDWWQPTDPEPFLRLGPDGSMSSGMIFSNPWLIPVNDELWFYYSGMKHDHIGLQNKASDSGIFRARLRRDGFVAATAGYYGGEFTTPIVTFTGEKMMVNLDGSAGGWLQVEIISAAGEPIDGYRLDQCETLRGNSVNKCVKWQGQPDISLLVGKPVRLRFVMRSMRLFAFQFQE